MLAGESLSERLAVLPGVTFDGALYRAVSLEALFGFQRQLPTADRQPLYSLGATARGARYTPREGTPTLYAAEHATTALLEATQAGAPVHCYLSPTVLFTLRARLDRVLDLADPEIQEALGTSTRELLGQWRVAQAVGRPVPTQTLGTAAFHSERFHAIRYPSSQARRRCCFAIFSERLAPSSLVEVYDPDGNLSQRLP